MCLYNFGDYIASERIYVRSVVRLNQNKKIESFLNQIQLQLFLSREFPENNARFPNH